MVAGGKLQPGDVLIHPAFTLPAGNTEDKMLVIFGERQSQVLFFLTTSQEKYGRHKKAQCQPQEQLESSFFLLARKGYFSMDTWIMFESLQRPDKYFIDRLSTGKCHRAFSLTQQDFQALRNCFERCWEYAPVYKEFK